MKLILPKRLSSHGQLVLCMAAMLAIVPSADANMLVYPMSASIGPGGSSAAELRVYSKSEETQYVKATVQRVVDPATDHEREEGDAVSGDHPVVISPAKFALPAGGTRLVRVIPLSAPQKEALYRIYLHPVAPPGEDDVDTGNDTAGKVSFNLVWAPLVHVLPKVVTPDLDVSEGTLINTGNVRLGLLEAGACATARDESSCRWTTFERSVYPDQKFKLDGLSSAPYVRIRYRVEGMSDVQQKVVPTHPIDTMGVQSTRNVTNSGHSLASINHKD